MSYDKTFCEHLYNNSYYALGIDNLELHTEEKTVSFTYTAGNEAALPSTTLIAVFSHKIQYAFVKEISASQTSYALNISNPVITENAASVDISAHIGNGKTMTVSITLVGIY